MLMLVKEARMAILMSDKVDFGSDKIINDREKLKIIKWSIHQ